MKLSRLYAAAAACALLSASVSPAFAAAGVTGSISGQVQGQYTGSNDLASVTAAFSQKATASFTPGVGTGQADKFYSKTRTITASSSENLDLAGVLPDPFGATLTFVKVKAIYISAAASNTNDVCFGGAASNGFLGPFADATDIHCVRPGGFEVISNPVGWTVVAATGDLLKVANSSSGTAVTY
jgi:hypothetical protein